MPRVYSTPGVYREEVDISEILVATGISNGGIVINSTKGPVNRPVLIRNDQEFVDTFGEPFFVSGAEVTAGPNPGDVITNIPAFYPEFGYGSYAALEFLKESTVLYVVRNVEDGDAYAGLNVSANQDQPVSSVADAQTKIYEQLPVGATQITSGPADKPDRIQSLDTCAAEQTDNLFIASVSPGIDGNNYGVTLELYNSACDWANSYDTYTSGYEVSARPIGSNVFKLSVFYKGGTANSWTDFELLAGDTSANNERLRIAPLETFYGTLIPLLDGNKNQLFIEDIVNGNSKYIYVKATGITWGLDPASTGITEAYRPVRLDDNGLTYINYYRLLQLGGGAVVAPDQAGLTNDQTAAWYLFEDRENAAVGILIAPTYNNVVKREVARIAASRADCIAVLQTGDPTDETTAEVNAAELYSYLNPSYAGLYDGYSKAYDKFNDRFVYLPNAIYAAMLYARVDNIANPWDAPAGVNRATIQVFDQRRIWTFAEIGQMYDKNINSVRFMPGTGFVMWGQKTAQLKKSALDRVNVRRNLLYIENNVELSLVQFIFENNTIRTRARVFSLIDPFLDQVKAGGGLIDYKLVVDETNNTPEIIDANQMNVDIYVQPTKAIEFIQLRTIITRTGVSFEEVAIA